MSGHYRVVRNGVACLDEQRAVDDPDVPERPERTDSALIDESGPSRLRRCDRQRDVKVGCADVRKVAHKWGTISRRIGSTGLARAAVAWTGVDGALTGVAHARAV